MGAAGKTAIVAAGWLLAASPTSSDELLAMRVSAYAPGSLTIRLTARPDAQNRTLVVSAESRDFYRSSEIQLDGEGAPHTTVVELRGLPTDMYEVTGILVGTTGPRAKVMRLARVLPDRRGR
jgi:hypothetical protein